jgi:hypothetical protein
MTESSCGGGRVLQANYKPRQAGCEVPGLQKILAAYPYSMISPAARTVPRQANPVELLLTETA